MKKYVWLNSTGKFLVVGERKSFAPGGRSTTTYFVESLDEASVLMYLPKEVSDAGLIRVEAVEERKVYLKESNNDHQ